MLKIMQAIENWSTDQIQLSAMFQPLRHAGCSLSLQGWPDIEAINSRAENCDTRPVNAHGEHIRFVAQGEAMSGEQFEAVTYLRAEVAVRMHNWHDLFNALVWMTFPLAKAALNARHFAESDFGSVTRSPVRDAITHFDEDGVVVIASDPTLLELLRAHQWKTLFVERRQAVRADMRAFVFGHALYDKARAPFPGMTGKALLFNVTDSWIDALEVERLHRIDRLLAACILDPAQFLSPRELTPLPVLGVPGWWPGNEDPSYYDDVSYFRPARSGAGASPQ